MARLEEFALRIRRLAFAPLPITAKLRWGPQIRKGTTLFFKWDCKSTTNF